jgi:predicted Zn-dependent protease
VTCLLTVGGWLGATQAGYGFSLRDLLPSAVELFQLSTMSDAREVSIGSQIDAQLKGNGDITLYNNATVRQFVEDIGERLVAVGDRPDLPFTFQVVNDSSINAFATLGGFVYVNTGLIALAENEAELAGVIAHEIGHITEKHVIDRMKQAAIARGVAGSVGLDDSVLVSIGYDLALSLPSSRGAEYEADEVGLAMLTGAGYAPSGIVTFFEKLAAASGSGRPPTFLSTHPATESRIDRLNRQIDEDERDQGDGLDAAAYRRDVSPL